MRDFIPGLALALIAFLLAAPAHAADIKIDVEQRYLVVEGRLVHEDFETFKTKAAQITGGARVFLTSEGGSMWGTLAVQALQPKAMFPVAASPAPLHYGIDCCAAMNCKYLLE